MKKLLIIPMAFAALFFTNCSKDTEGEGGGASITQSQNVIMVDVTATWCPPCGKYGAPAFLLALEEKPERTVGIAAHVNSSELGAQPGQDLGGHYKASGIPRLAAGDESTGAFSDPNATKSKLVEFAEKVWSRSSIVNSAIKTTIKDGELTATVDTKFFSDTEADKNYKIAVYLLEDGIVNRQSVTGVGYVNDFEHGHVLRASATPTLGADISATAGSIAANSTFKKDYFFDVSSYDAANLSVVAVIWYEKGGSVFFENVDTSAR